MPYVEIDTQASPPIFQLSMDIASDCTIGELLQFMETYGARLHSFVAVGPAGGNPFMTFAFDSAAELNLFKATYQVGFCNPVSMVTENLPDVSEEDLPEFGEGRGMEPTKPPHSKEDLPE